MKMTMLLKKRTRRVCCPDDSCSSSRVMNTNNTTTTNDNNNQNAGNSLSFSLSSLFSSLSLSLKNKRERKLLASFFTRELISFSLSLFLSGRVSKLLFRVINETLTTQFGLLASKERKSPQNHITRIEELLKLLGKSSSWQNRCSEEEE